MTTPFVFVLTTAVRISSPLTAAKLLRDTRYRISQRRFSPTATSSRATSVPNTPTATATSAAAIFVATAQELFEAWVRFLAVKLPRGATASCCENRGRR